MRSREALVLLVVALSCGPPGDPSISISPSPRAIDDVGGVTTLTVRANYWNADPGMGSVTVTSAAGSLTTPVNITLDKDGKALTDFSCDKAADPACMGSVRVIAEWTVMGKKAGAATSVMVGGAGGGGGGGSTGVGTPCMAGETPGLSVTCCENDAVGVLHPPCDWFHVIDGQTLSVPFRTGAGTLVTFPVHFTVTSSYAGRVDCQSGAQASGAVIDLKSINSASPPFFASCDDGAVQSDGLWSQTENDINCGGINQNLGINCDQLYNNGALGIWRAIKFELVAFTAGGTQYHGVAMNGTRPNIYYFVNKK